MPAQLFCTPEHRSSPAAPPRQAALIGNPFVVVYRVSPVTYAIARRVVRVPHVAMVNLIAANQSYLS